MIQEIHKLLDDLKLRHAREIIAQSLRDAQKNKPSYSSFLLDLLRQEYQDKRDRTTNNRLKRSGLREFWMLQTFPWHIQTCMSKHKRSIYELAELDFIDRGESIIFSGLAGVGKSGLASAIFHSALLAGRTGHAFKAQELFDEFDASLADRSTRSRLKRLSRLDIILLDEFGYISALNQSQVNNFFRLMDARSSRKSTLITTNLGFQEWSKFLGNGPLTAALLSRLLQKCHVFPFPKDAVNLRDPKWKLPTCASLPSSLTRD